MKLTITKREYCWIMAALHAAYEHEETLAAAQTDKAEKRKVARRARQFRRLRTRLYHKAAEWEDHDASARNEENYSKVC